MVLKPTNERMVPESSDRSTFWEHVYRYNFASSFVKGKRVLDIACGEGYGAAALQRAGATHVIGVDVSEDVCVHAHRKYGLDARLGSAEQIPLTNKSIEVIVSFETIEHVTDPYRFLDECARVLVPGGMVIISTPNKGIYGVGVQNPYHCSEMTELEFVEALQARFRNVSFYTQRPYSAGWWSLRALAAEVSIWNRIRGLRRLHHSARLRLAPRVVCEPTDEQRSGVVEQILSAGKSRYAFLSPYVLRPHRKWTRERPTYLIATAIH